MSEKSTMESGVEALAEALSALAPGVRMHMALAGNVERMLRKRGFVLAAAQPAPPAAGTREALTAILAALSPLTVMGRPIASLDAKLSRAIRDGVLALDASSSSSPVEVEESGRDGWNLIIDRDPPNMEPVLVAIPTGSGDYDIWSAWWDGARWTETYSGECGLEASHWRQLPDPPTTSVSEKVEERG